MQLVLVDDGSVDGTGAILERIRAAAPTSVTTLGHSPRRGKAEAVRAGMLAGIAQGAALVGFFDADLSTPLHAVDDFLAVLRQRPDVEFVLGSRVMLMGRDIRRKATRHYLGRVFATAVSHVLDLPVYDTQCGAKMLRVNAATATLFAEPFDTGWIFDVELIARYLRLPVAPGEPARRDRLYELVLPAVARPARIEAALARLRSARWSTSDTFGASACGAPRPTAARRWPSLPRSRNPDGMIESSPAAAAGPLSTAFMMCDTPRSTNGAAPSGRGGAGSRYRRHRTFRRPSSRPRGRTGAGEQTMTNEKQPPAVSRRTFMSTAAAAAGITIVPRHVLGGTGIQAPSDTVNVAVVGYSHGMGTSNLMNVAKSDNIVALCDCDTSEAAKAAMAKRGTLEKFPKAVLYKDWRQMLEKQKDIEAVVVATPDHNHAVIAMAAMQPGKHVYVQKPLTRTVSEARALTEAARKYKVVTQMGNQGHSEEGLRLMQEWLAAGAIGAVREVHCWTNRPVWPQGMPRPTDTPAVPDGSRLGSVDRPRADAPVPHRRITRSGGAPGRTSAPAPWATWAAMSWTRPSRSSSSARRPA